MKYTGYFQCDGFVIYVGETDAGEYTYEQRASPYEKPPRRVDLLKLCELPPWHREAAKKLGLFA